MAINLDLVREERSNQLGNVTGNRQLTGVDVSGSFNSGLTVTGIQGVPCVSGSVAGQANLSYVQETPTSDFVRNRVVLHDESMPNSGSVRGDYDSGVNVFNIYNGLIKTTATVPSFTESGDGLVYDGADFLEVKQLNSITHIIVTDSTITAKKNDRLIVDSTAGDLTIAPPSTSNDGDVFYLHHLKSDTTINTVTVSFSPVFELSVLSSVMFVRLSGEWIPQNIGTPFTP